jgi:uncharacterized protein YndB with AHSA1/START domain
MSSLDIRLERLIDTTPDVAFHHWVDADARRRWCAPEEGWIIEADTDLRVGGAWSVAFGPTPDEMYRTEGVFEEVDPPRRLVYNSIFRYPDGRTFETNLTVTFEAREGKTLLTVLDAGYPNEQQRAEHESGLPAFLDAFERTLAA